MFNTVSITLWLNKSENWKILKVLFAMHTIQFLFFFWISWCQQCKSCERKWKMGFSGLTCGPEDFSCLSWLRQPRAIHLGPCCLNDSFQHLYTKRNHWAKCTFCVTVGSGVDPRLFRAIASHVYVVFLLQLLSKNTYYMAFSRKVNLNYIWGIWNG